HRRPGRRRGPARMRPAHRCPARRPRSSLSISCSSGRNSPRDRLHGMTADRLARRLGTRQALVVGLSAMIGAGGFTASAPAAAAAGAALPIALLVAGVVAYCNATSSARLAVRYPDSGGTYVYGRERLGPFWGYLAGWGFVVGKTASCAAMALTVVAYAAPNLEGPWPGLLAAAVVAALTLLNYHGVQRSARAAAVLVTIS